ncbi:MAG: hypothetical protein AUH43_05150 [Acidobacteria bacterium 13_1_40CM_65_14]|nr:MAG: hypothetical protein AUH43_05150 [Acidobacteria bacterium 13_1_40CM_65_14]OLC84380.1 MAG: hypothetical protein AUH72_02075 [Acidobacteria bacterium 13_1_40CM_4_65_8]
MWRQLIVRYVAAAMAFVACAACGGQSASAPTSTPPPSNAIVRAKLEVTSVTVTGESLTTGYAYRTVVHLKETAGVAAAIASIDLKFLSGGATVASLRHEQPISDSSNVCPANGAVDTRELVTLDNDPSHSYATTVRAIVTYTDSTTTVSTAEGSAEVGAASGPPPAQTYTLTGVISDDSTRRGIGGARIEVISGANLGKATTADASGRYVLDDLAAGSFRLRASAGGYDAGEQGIAVPANPQADFTLKQSVGCFYTLSPLSESVSAAGGSRSFTVTPSAATGCTWRASSSDPWITINGAASGSGAAAVSYTVAPNSGVGALLGSITIQWASGRAAFSVFQYPVRTNCQPEIVIHLSPNAWEAYVPLAVGCYIGKMAIDVPWVRVLGTHGGGTLLDVRADANAGAARTGHIRFSDERVYLQITINQDAAR